MPSELADLGRTLPLAAHVNLIPLNPTPGWPTKGTSASGVRLFRDLLVALGVNATDPPQPGHGHRRGLRPAGRRAGGDAGPGPRRGYSTW